MFLEEMSEGERQEEWPHWFKLTDEPILLPSNASVASYYVVLPQPE